MSNLLEFPNKGSNISNEERDLIAEILEMQLKIKYFLDQIEMRLPSRRQGDLKVMTWSSWEELKEKYNL